MRWIEVWTLVYCYREVSHTRANIKALVNAQYLKLKPLTSMHQKTGEKPMKKSTLILALFALLSTMFVVPVYASVSINAFINDSIYVVYKLENLNSTIYDEVKTNGQFNISTIPSTIIKNLEDQGQNQVRWWLGPQTDIFNDANRTIIVSFYLGGSDIISFTVNRTTMKRTCQVKTDWRKFQLNLTSTLQINFTQYLAEPVEKWQKPNQTTYYIETRETGFLDVLSFNLALPTTATNVQVQGDTITYDVPPYLEDIILNSPFPILIVLFVIIIIALIYRTVK